MKSSSILKPTSIFHLSRSHEGKTDLGDLFLDHDLLFGVFHKPIIIVNDIVRTQHAIIIIIIGHTK